MSEVSQCDLYCPRKAFLGAEYRQNTEGVSAIKRHALATALGVRGVVQVTRASMCPQRHEPTETWQPREECAGAVQTALAAHPLDPAALNDYERQVLGPYLDPGQSPNEA